MPRARNIKPGFFESEQVGSVSPCARLLFIALWQLADREGRLEDRPKRIQYYAFRYDDQKTISVELLLQELLEQSLIDRYENNGVKVISIPAFRAHQHPHATEKNSELPEKPRQERCNNGAITVQAPLDNGAIPLQIRLNPECGILNADVLNQRHASQAPPVAPAQQQQRNFPDFGSDPDPQGLIDELVEEIAQHWPRPGNVPLAKRVWEREAATAVGGVAAWCSLTRSAAAVHSLAHLQAVKANPRHFVPDLVRWVVDGDFRRPAPVIGSSTGPERPSRFDPASLQEAT